MEQVGTSGLPPLMASVPIPVPVSEAELPVTEAEEVIEEDGICNLTELVPVRSKQPPSSSDLIEEVLVEEEQVEEEGLLDPQEDPLAITTKGIKTEIKNTVALIVKSQASAGMLQEPNVDQATTPAATSETPSNILSEGASDMLSEAHSERSSGPPSLTPAFQVPPHLLGRTIENPAADIPPGRRMQKPRLGVRVPYRNLTSQIVTRNEIAQEIFERAAKKNPNILDPLPEAGALPTTEIFTRKLTQRLASSISPQVAKPKATVSETIGTLKALLPNKQAPGLADGVRLSPGFTHSEKDKTLDDAELLSILEGDGDPVWLPDKLLRKVEGTPTPTPPPVVASASASPTAPVLSPAVPPATAAATAEPASPPASNTASAASAATPSPPKLDPELEKELALKQLSELPLKFPSRKPEKKAEKPTRRRSGKLKKEVVDLEETGLIMEVESAPVLEPAVANVPAAAPVTVVAIPNGAGAPGTENAPPNIPVKKPASHRKRKLTPEVEAVLKKPKLAKRAESAANGKVKGGKASNTPAAPSVQAAPTTPASEPKKTGRRGSQVKPSPTAVVANGNSEPAGKKKSPANKRGGRPKAEERPKTKTPPKTTSKKDAKTTSKASNKTTPQKYPKQPAEGAAAVEEIAAGKEPTVPTVQPELIEEEREQRAGKEPEVQPGLPTSASTTPALSAEELMPQPAPASAKKPTRINRELEYLLGDEGAVNMLYAVEGRNKIKASSNDLALKARLVKTAVMRLSTNPLGHVPLALRARRSLNTTEPPKLVRMGGKRRQRQLSDESHDSTRSPPYLTPVDGVASHVFLPRQKLTADDSRIIRRHSSSSSFSSPSVSPRRVSVEDGKGEAAAAGVAAGAGGSPRKRGIPIFVRDTAKSMTYSGKKKPRVVNPVALDMSLNDKLLDLQAKKLLPNPAAIKKKKSKVRPTEVLSKLKKGVDGATALAAKEAVRLRKFQLASERRAVEELAKAKKAAEQLLKLQQHVEELTTAQDNAKVVAPPIHPTAIKQEGVPSGRRGTAPHSPDTASQAERATIAPAPAAPEGPVACQCTMGLCSDNCASCVTGPLFCMSSTGYTTLLKSLDQKGRRPQAEPQRATVRHCAGTYTYKEITVRRFDNVVQIVLSPMSTKLSSAMNVQVLRELNDALMQVKKDESCRVVLLTSSGSIFCQGIDVSTLVHTNVEKRKTAAIEMSLALKDFLKCIAHYPKPLVAGVQGAAAGLGVTMLPLFDMVFASDKATFHTPYAQLGQVPEGAATLTLPYMFGHTATSELLLNCRKLTANEALQFGLVTRVLWPDRFLEELIPAVKTIAQQSAQSMEATKALLRHGLRTKFDAALESETHLLITHWTSQECQTAFQRLLENDDVIQQRQRSVDA